MNTAQRVGIVGVTVVAVLVAGKLWAQSPPPPAPELSAAERSPAPEPLPQPRGSSAAELPASPWSGGSSVGILGSTPDGTAFAMNGNAEYFVNEHVAIGPLAQLAFTGDMVQVGLSGQGKYYIDLPGTNNRGKVSLQSGVGFMHSSFRDGDTSWLVPVGVGYDYTLDSGAILTATSLVNFTNLHTGGGTGADVMPGFAFGMRF